jgi:hypothetical protein
MKHSHLLSTFSTLALGSSLFAAEKLELQPKDHVAIIGNALTERMLPASWDRLLFL